MNIKKSEKLLKKWKKKLGLQNWKILLQINQTAERMDENQGYIEVDVTHSVALIRIIDKKQYPSDCIGSFDFEKTLVHELLHIKFELFTPKNKKTKYRILHQSLEDMAALLTGYENKSIHKDNIR